MVKITERKTKRNWAYFLEEIALQQFSILYIDLLYLNTSRYSDNMSEITKIKITKKVIKDESKRIPCNY